MEWLAGDNCKFLNDYWIFDVPCSGDALEHEVGSYHDMKKFYYIGGLDLFPLKLMHFLIVKFNKSFVGVFWMEECIVHLWREFSTYQYKTSIPQGEYRYNLMKTQLIL